MRPEWTYKNLRKKFLSLAFEKENPQGSFQAKNSKYILYRLFLLEFGFIVVFSTKLVYPQGNSNPRFIRERDMS